MDAYKTPRQHRNDARKVGKWFGIAWITMFLLSIGVGTVVVWGFIRLVLHFT